MKMNKDFTLELISSYYDSDKKFRNAIAKAILEALENDLTKKAITDITEGYISLKSKIIKEQLKLEYYLMGKLNDDVISDEIYECFEKIYELYELLDTMESIKWITINI